MSEYGVFAANAVAAIAFDPESGLPEPPNGTHRPKKRAGPKQPDPATIQASFNTWSFKREQPNDPQLMLRFIAEAIAAGEPIPFVLYWGKGPRNMMAGPDVACLDYLAAFARRVGEAYDPGAALKLIFTDTHAQLNGHSVASMRQYFGEIEDAGRQRGFDSRWLGAITHAADRTSLAGLAHAEAPAEVIQLLSASATKWYRGEGTCEQGAVEYYRMNMIERRAVELAFPRSIFITFNGSKLRALFPERLPIFYMYSLRRGVAVKPWFLPSETAPADDVAALHCVPQLQGG